MRYTPAFGGVPTIGVELEFLDWEGKRTYTTVQRDLVEAGYMPKNVYGPRERIAGYETTLHQYNCRCKGCATVISTRSIPVRWTGKYDGSLPPSGAEFISSPTPLIEPLLYQIVDAYNIMRKDAVWNPKGYRNRTGDADASTGMHVHVSLPNREVDSRTCQRTYKMFYPEILALASTVGVARGLYYRHPIIEYGDHHVFLATSNKGGAAHIEWRMAEMPQDNVDYLIGMIGLAAAATQVSSVPKVFKALEGFALLNDWTHAIEGMRMDEVMQLSFDQIMAFFSERRLEVLASVVSDCSSLSTMPDALDSFQNIVATAIGEYR